MSSPPPVNDDDVPGGLEADAQPPAGDAAPTDDESSGTDIPSREPVVADEPADSRVGPPSDGESPAFEDSDAVTLTDAIIYAGGSPTLPESAHKFTAAGIGPIGKLPLRIIWRRHHSHARRVAGWSAGRPNQLAHHHRPGHGTPGGASSPSHGRASAKGREAAAVRARVGP